MGGQLFRDENRTFYSVGTVRNDVKMAETAKTYHALMQRSSGESWQCLCDSNLNKGMVPWHMLRLQVTNCEECLLELKARQVNLDTYN